MKILLINPRDNFTQDNEMFPRLSLTLFAALLRPKGHTVKIIHMVADYISTEEQITTLLKEYRPDIVGITLTTYQTKWTRIVSRVVKEHNKDIKVVIGGPHPSAVGESALDYFPNVDIVIGGEGEITFTEVVEGKALSKIDGIYYREGGSKITTPKRALYEPLDNLPFPDYSSLNIKRFAGPYPIKRLPHMFIMGSRGCPNQCTFCAKQVYGPRVRNHSPEYITEYIKYLRRDFGTREVSFEDDTFNLKREWTVGVFESIIRNELNKDLVYRTGFRVDKELVDLELLKLAKRAGFWVIFYGVENGNQGMLDRMKKNITLGEIKRAFKLTHQVGLKTQSPFIIGLPGETEDTIRDSIKLSKELGAFTIGFARAMPFPGTAFEKEVRKRGHLIEGDYDDYSYVKTRVRTDALTSEELEQWAKYCAKLALKALAKKCLTNPSLLPMTIKAVGLKELISKVARNIK